MSRPQESGQLVYATIVDLSNANRIATRPVIAEITELPMTKVDYYVQKFVSDGILRRVLNGVYELVAQGREDRAISGTWTPSGEFKLEVGDECLTLSLREARAVGFITAGISVLFSSAGVGRQ